MTPRALWTCTECRFVATVEELAHDHEDQTGHQLDRIPVQEPETADSRRRDDPA